MAFGALVVHVGDAAVDGGFEIVGIGEGPVGEVMTLQIAPGELDRVVMMTLSCWFLLRPRSG
jgi:hypothetical protein